MSVTIGTDTGFVDFLERPIHIGDVVTYTTTSAGTALNMSVIKRITKHYVCGTSYWSFVKLKHRNDDLKGYDMSSLIEELIKRTALDKADQLITPSNCVIVKKYNGEL